MRDLEWMLALLPGTAIAENVKRVFEAYRELDGEIASFQDAAGIGCPDGCGICCEETDPEVTQAEADFIALYLVFSKRDPIGALNPRHRGCVFYDPSGPLHCTIYATRPLLCRAFAFTSVRDKAGNPVFRYCRHMPATGDRVLTADGIARRFSVSPPGVALYGIRIAALSDKGGSGRAPLSHALARSIGRVLLLKRFASDDESPDSGGRAA